MENLKEKFSSLYRGEAFSPLLKTGVEIKQADKALSKRLSLISLVSVLGMTVLGFFALGIIGVIIFFLVTYTSTFFFTFSMKKRALLAYLKHYREKIPPVLFEGFEKIDKPEIPSTLNSLYPDTMHHWTTCYKKDELNTGFARIIKKNNEFASGMAAIVPGSFSEGHIFKGWFPAFTDDFVEEVVSEGALPDGAQELASVLDKHFDAFAICTTEDYAVLYLPTAQDFMTSRVEDSDGMTPEALARQFAYFTLAEAFKSFDASCAQEALSLFGEAFPEENEIYQKLLEKKKK